MSKVVEKQPTRRSVRRVAERLWRIGAIPCKSIRQTHCTIQTIAIFWVSISGQKANLGFCNHSVECFPCISLLKSIADHENHPRFLPEEPFIRAQSCLVNGAVVGHCQRRKLTEQHPVSDNANDRQQDDPANPGQQRCRPQNHRFVERISGHGHDGDRHDHCEDGNEKRESHDHSRNGARTEYDRCTFAKVRSFGLLAIHSLFAFLVNFVNRGHDSRRHFNLKRFLAARTNHRPPRWSIVLSTSCWQ